MHTAGKHIEQRQADQQCEQQRHEHLDSALYARLHAGIDDRTRAPQCDGRPGKQRRHVAEQMRELRGRLHRRDLMESAHERLPKIKQHPARDDAVGNENEKRRQQIEVAHPHPPR